MVLFRVIDKKTRKSYEDPYKLCESVEGDESLNPEVLHPGINGGTHIADIFRPDDFLMDDEGDLYIMNSVGDTYYLPRERFKPLWNFKHELLRDVVKYGF